MTTVTTMTLSQVQFAVLLAVYIAEAGADALITIKQSQKAHTNAESLADLGALTISDTEVALTQQGLDLLLHNGYIDGGGEVTEFGRKFYQHAVTSHLMEYKLLQSLMQSKRL